MEIYPLSAVQKALLIYTLSRSNTLEIFTMGSRKPNNKLVWRIPRDSTLDECITAKNHNKY